MKKILGTAMVALVLALVSLSAVASGGHTLIVDGQEYQHSQVSGPVIHWYTPTANPQSASFPERQQVWQGHGSEHLPCSGQVH